MARRDPAAVWFQTRYSRYLLVFFTGLHGLALLALWLTPLPAWAWALSGLALVGHGRRLVRTHAAHRGREGVRALHWQSDGAWRVLTGDGRVHRYEDVAVTLAEPWAILMTLAGPGARPRKVLLARDSAAPDALRRLRVRLRTRPPDELDQPRPLAGT